MDYNFSELKKKKVINVADGKDLGRVTDFVVSYPDGKIKSVIVSGRKASFFMSAELIFNFGCIERIGDDAILVRLCGKKDLDQKSVQSERFDIEQ